MTFPLVLPLTGAPVRTGPSSFAAATFAKASSSPREPVAVVFDSLKCRFGVLLSDPVAGAPDSVDATVTAVLPALYPEWLGDRSFCEVHGVRFPYVVGEMANGLTTIRMVVEAARAGFLGFFGAAGIDPARIEDAVAQLSRELDPASSWGSNLIHSPQESALEDATVEVYLRRGVRRVSASAFMRLTLPVVRYAASGLTADATGQVRRRHHLFAKISRPETARFFLAPAPQEMLDALVAAGRLTREEADLARRVPLAEDITIEADSGGHTDNRPLAAIFPSIARAAADLAALHGHGRQVRLGAAGGLGTPSAVAAAFALGAAYVLTGSVNQAAVESGLGASGRALLAQAGVADVAMAPSADMFELGVQVQVLKRGTLFAARARRLRELYKSHDSLEEIPAGERERLEKEIFLLPLEAVLEQTERFWAARDPRQNERAGRDPKHRMALCFRWYLGQSSRWAIADDPARRADYQIWCGPAMGAFNDWVRGSFLEEASRRTVAQIGRNLLEGAIAVTRAQQLRACGVPVSLGAFYVAPRPLA
jgi:PfaD family protein